MGRVGSCFDNAAAEAFFSSLEWEVLSRNHFADTDTAQAVAARMVLGSTTTPAGTAALA